MRSVLLCLLLLLGLPLTLLAQSSETALDVFKQRIEPIMKSPKASSCSECHLSGVDLKDYLKPDQADTFAALRDAGLIDIKQPDSSKLLKFISRKPENPSLITDKIRQQEFEAVRAWIRLAAKDPTLLKAKLNKDEALELPPVEVIRHGRQDQILNSFVDNVWSEVGRSTAQTAEGSQSQPDRKRPGGRSGSRFPLANWLRPHDRC